jgi:hypothetical protein
MYEVLVGYEPAFKVSLAVGHDVFEQGQISP